MISNADSELNLNINNFSDGKGRHNESYLEKNLQTEDFNLSYSEVNIRQNASRFSKNDVSAMNSNDASLSHQSIFRNSLISRNPSTVLNKFQFFSNDDNDMDNFNFKHKIPYNESHNNLNTINRNSLTQSQNEIPGYINNTNTNKLGKSQKDLESLRNSYSMLGGKYFFLYLLN